MRMETSSNGLRLKALRVREVRQEPDRLVCGDQWIESRNPIYRHSSRRTGEIHSRQRAREWRDSRVRDQAPTLRHIPRRVRCPAFGPRLGPPVAAGRPGTFRGFGGAIWEAQLEGPPPSE